MDLRPAICRAFSDAYKTAFDVRPRFSVIHLSNAELLTRVEECYAMAARDASLA